MTYIRKNIYFAPYERYPRSPGLPLHDATWRLIFQTDKKVPAWIFYIIGSSSFEQEIINEFEKKRFS